MGRFSHWNPKSPENQQFWESIKNQVHKLLNEINEQVFDGIGEVKQNPTSCYLWLDPKPNSAKYGFYTFTVLPHPDGKNFVRVIK